MKKTKERIFTDAEMCEIVESAILEYGLNGWTSSAGFCYYFACLFGDSNNSDEYYKAKEVVFFIKHYGTWRGRYIASDGHLVTDKSQFIYPMGQIEPRVRLMKKAVANYKKSLENKE